MRRKKSFPTGIVECNDMYGLLLMHALQAVGLSVPEDMAIISIDNLDVCALVRPSLTSVLNITSQPLKNFIGFFDNLMRGKKTDTSLVPLFSPSVQIRDSA